MDQRPLRYIDLKVAIGDRAVAILLSKALLWQRFTTSEVLECDVLVVI